MNRGMTLILLVSFATLLSPLRAKEEESNESEVSAALKDLPPVFSEQKYKIDPYIRAALALQALGKETACKKLESHGQDKENSEKVIVLCRMLFTEKKGDK